MKRILSTALAAAFLLAATPAMAFQCPTDINKIDEALASDAGEMLSATDRATVKQLRDEGERLHKAGDHQASVDTLAEAKEVLGIE